MTRQLLRVVARIPATYLPSSNNSLLGDLHAALDETPLHATLQVGTDVDSLAVKAAARNGALNGFGPPRWLVVLCGAGLADPEPLTAAALAAAAAAGADAAAQGPAAAAGARLRGGSGAGGRETARAGMRSAGSQSRFPAVGCAGQSSVV
jgi:hypothetical protein